LPPAAPRARRRRRPRRHRRPPRRRRPRRRLRRPAPPHAHLPRCDGHDARRLPRCPPRVAGRRYTRSRRGRRAAARLPRFHPQRPPMPRLAVLVTFRFALPFGVLAATPLAAQPADSTAAFAGAMDAFVSETLEALGAVPGLA